MAYNLNTPTPSARIVLSDTGSFYGPKHKPSFNLMEPLNSKQGVLSLVSLEKLYFTHPTYFRFPYMELVMTLNGQTYRLNPDSFVEHGNFFRHPLYLSKDITLEQKMVALDSILWHLLCVLRSPFPTDPNIPPHIPFEDYVVRNRSDMVNIVLLDMTDNVKFLYTDLTYNQTLLERRDAFRDFNPLGDRYDDPHNIEHREALLNLIERRNFRFGLGYGLVRRLVQGIPPVVGVDVFTLRGPLMSWLGASPEKEFTFSITADPLVCRLPFYGHEYICVTSSLTNNQLVSMTGTAFTASDLLAVVPTPKVPGEYETYFNTSTGGKLELSDKAVDCITLGFIDSMGYPLLSIDDFVAVIVVDYVYPTPAPQEDRVRLDKIRNETMDRTRAAIRKHLRTR